MGAGEATVDPAKVEVLAGNETGATASDHCGLINMNEPAARSRHCGGFCSHSSAACAAVAPHVATLAHVVHSQMSCDALFDVQLKQSFASARALALLGAKPRLRGPAGASAQVAEADAEAEANTNAQADA